MSSIRNVLLVSIDCLRADRFQQGIESGILPRLASLTRDATRFEAAFTVANTTDPSLTSFMTGAYPFGHGVVENGWGLGDSWPVAAERFREAGYDTFGVVSVDHLSHEYSGLGRGFEHYFDGDAYDALYPVLSRIYDTKTFNTLFGAIKDLGTQRYTVKSLLRDLGLIDLHCRSAGSVTADAIEGLDRAEEPFFGWVHYFDAHEPRNAPRDLLGEHDEYTAALINVDRHVGRVLDALYDRGLAEETLVVLTGDHGEALGDHGYTGHGRTLYDEELRVPLVFAHDSLPADAIDTQVRTIDILPTLLELGGADALDAAGNSVFDGNPGENLSAERSPVETDRPVFAMAYPTFGDRVAVQSGSWKLVRDRETDTEELYHLAEDPDERDDRTDEKTSRRDRLAADLEDWLSGFSATQRQEVDAQTQAMLADLGYAE